MFNAYESSDERKRDAVMARRLMSLRCARLAGYFDEEGSVPMPEIIADGDGLDSRPGSTALVKRFDYAAEEEAALGQWRKASNFLGRMRRMPPGGGPGTCPTCGRPEVMFVNGVCPGCGPSISKPALDAYAEMERLERELKAIESLCPVCFGFGTTDPDDCGRKPRKCRKCGGKGLIE